MSFSVRQLTVAWCAVVSWGLLGCATPLPPGAAVTPVGGFMPPEPPSGYTPKSIAFAPRDMVAAAHPLAVKAGVDVLAQGGSAVDGSAGAVPVGEVVTTTLKRQSAGLGIGLLTGLMILAVIFVPAFAWRRLGKRGIQ